MTSEIAENRFIEHLVAGFARSPLQLNLLHESDSEILRLPADQDRILAFTTDSIAEEIEVGLYHDPYLIGWMTTMVNMSDLAAVGASPIGILISEIFPPETSREFIDLIQKGIADSCQACSAFVLGGDTNAGPNLVLTGSALGVANRGEYMKRVGITAGDVVYSTGLLGAGNAFALAEYMRRQQRTFPPFRFQPTARLREGLTMARLASACMDTSDGVLSTLDQLMRLNQVGFEIEIPCESLLLPTARLVSEQAAIPPWLLLAGEHGEFELLFTVSPANEQALLAEMAHRGYMPLRLGRAIAETTIRMNLHGHMTDLDTCTIRNLACVCGTDIETYIRELCSIDRETKKGALSYVNC